MRFARRNCGCCELEGRIYAIGGSSSDAANPGADVQGRTFYVAIALNIVLNIVQSRPPQWSNTICSFFRPSRSIPYRTFFHCLA